MTKAVYKERRRTRVSGRLESVHLSMRANDPFVQVTVNLDQHDAAALYRLINAGGGARLSSLVRLSLDEQDE